jgi:endonuclease-3
VQYKPSLAYSRRVAESKAARAARVKRIVRALDGAYPDVRTALRFASPFELLIATILSAQSTDATVNRTTPELFRAYPDPAALAAADPADVERLVHATGFFRQKAKAIQATARDLVERYDGRVPPVLEDLVTLRGVARKTANVVLGNAFGIPGLAVDTHMTRVNQRLALTAHEDPVQIESDLAELVPRDAWTRYTNQVIHHGRVCCVARKPLCEECVLADDCPKLGVGEPPPRPRAKGAGAKATARKRSAARPRGARR